MPVARVRTNRPPGMGFDEPAEQTPDSGIIIGNENSDWHLGTRMRVLQTAIYTAGQTRPSTVIMMPQLVLGAIPSLPYYCCSYIRSNLSLHFPRCVSLYTYIDGEWFNSASS